MCRQESITSNNSIIINKLSTIDINTQIKSIKSKKTLNKVNNSLKIFYILIVIIIYYL